MFKYNFNKDVANFINGTQSINNSNPTKLQRAYIAKYKSNYDKSTVQEFLKLYTEKIAFNPSKSVKRLEYNWRQIEKQFIARTEKIFQFSYPASQITAYLTTNQRSTYNIQENFFFVNFSSKFPNHTIMHELLHFYTWHAFHDDLIENGIDEKQYNNIKESLTELLNIEFIDLMDGAHDDGYPQHIELRKKIRQLWSETKSLKKVIFGVSSG